MFNDLREFIAKAEELGECKVIEGADWNLEVGAITDLMSHASSPPLLVFDKIKGYAAGFRVASNLFSSARRTALGLGLPLEVRGLELVKAFREKMAGGMKLLPPVEVETGPVKENVEVGDKVDLSKFPTPIWHELDGGRYIGTGSVSVTRDPDEGWVNFGCYRVQVQGKNLVTLNIAPGQHGDIIRRKYWAKGIPCPVAVVCGQDPAVFAAGGAEGTPWGVSEYGVAGFLRGEPVKVTKGITTDLPIPATAEIVLEGEMMPPEKGTVTEGPFGEYSGYYGGGKSQQPVCHITSILYRNNPIIQGNPPSRLPSVWTLGRHIQKAASLWNELDKNMPGIKGVWMLEEASMHAIPIISIQQKYAGHAKQAGLIAAGCSATGLASRIIIVVDDDIDPSNKSEVLWALGTRIDPATSIDIIRGCRGTREDPMVSPERKKLGNYEMTRMIVIACKPYYWINDFPPSIGVSRDLAQKIKDKWPGLFSD